MNGSFRALLIGVPEYRDGAIPDLPFVTDDMAELADALASVGYEVAVHDPGETDRDGIDAAVEEFFQTAAEGETLLLCLSGHGIHHGGVDYLVPRGARTSAHDFPAKCLSLDFGPYVERSLAGDVAVFVDACREGITLRTMSVGNAIRWSDMEVDRIGDRHYGYVYACSPGESARYFREPGTAFSFFSRALSTVVADEAGPRTLAELSGRLQRELDRLSVEHGADRQRVRIRTETGLDDFVLFERPERTSQEADGEHPWVGLVGEHPAWTLAGAGRGAEAMREAATALVVRLAREADRDKQRLSADPWQVSDLAERMTGRLGWLLSKVIAAEKPAAGAEKPVLAEERPALSPAEAFLLAVVPFLHVAAANRAAVQALPVGPTDLAATADPSRERAGYEQFTARRARLVRRAAQSARAGDDAGAAGIAWWLFRQWLAQEPGGRYQRIVADLRGPVECLTEGVGAEADRRLIAGLFELGTLDTLLRALRSSYDPTTIRPVRQLAGSTVAEQNLREQLLVALLTVAHHLAIDPLRLPDVVVDHLGISYAVDLGELHRTILGAGWETRGRTRVLTAACHHPAVGLALREHAASLDALLRAIDIQTGSDPQLAPLHALPPHATADQVRAAVDAQGRPVYESTGLRFRLADDRIQELLMGEQLYGDPALAVRELYQNALDACRYREARTDYLRLQRPRLSKWSGRIDFEQGVDDQGRAYIECRDNGIGMGERELREVFSHAGMRFADLPEFVDEYAAWRAKGIDFHANSRFGIGVLSYFMIADDIVVSTCRLDREGHPGKRLEVHIAGPGSLFRIRDLGRDYDAGTSVRLYLRSPDTAPSCTDLLRRLLWRSQYTVTAQGEGDPLRWEAGELSPVAPLGARDPYEKGATRAPDARADATDRADVWWVDCGGGVLADGLWVGLPLFGAVVDLGGDNAPRLTVDRREALSYDTGHVADVLRRQIPALLRPDARVLDHAWLSELVDHDPELADAVAEEAAARGFVLRLSSGYSADIAVVGCFPADVELFRREHSGRPLFRVPQDMPAYLADWRALAWVAGGGFAGVAATGPGPRIVARPTDRHMLVHVRRAKHVSLPMVDDEGRNNWLETGLPVPTGHVLAVAARLKRPPSAVSARLAEFGLRGPEGALVPADADPDDLVLLSEGLDRGWPWLDQRRTVRMHHVLRCAQKLGWSPPAVAARLTAFGFGLPEGVIVPEAVNPADLTLLEAGQSVSAYRLGHDRVALDSVLVAAERLGWSPRVAAARLEELGLALPDGTTVPETMEPGDRRIVGGKGPLWTTPGFEGRLWLGHVLWCAAELGWSPQAVVARLEEFGLALPAGAAVPESVEQEDLLLLSEDRDGVAPWLNHSSPVPIGHVLVVAAQLGWSPQAVVARLEEFGFSLPVGATVPETVEQEDLLLLCRELDLDEGWLEFEDPLLLKHVMDAAVRLRREPAKVAARLRELGHRLPEGCCVPDSTDPLSLAVLGVEVGRRPDPLTIHELSSLGRVLRVAHRVKCPPSAVQARFKELGFHPTADWDLPATVTAEDIEMIELDRGRGDGQVLDPREPVGVAHVLQASSGKSSPADVASRLEALGFTLSGDVTYTTPEGWGTRSA
ncbi:wHTH domain-containing protein [Kitasatospora sp. NBC_00458]|uniref:wHTH domain-containing protein n=1 Tax=Kitasatospora sp. NBC_00458 TaxID=2903568 RepID=UPI002E17674D